MKLSLFGSALRSTQSPDNRSGGSVPLPSFGPNGEYIPPTTVPIGDLPLQPPRNQLWRSELTPEEQEQLQKDILGKLKAWRQSTVPPKLSF